MRNTLILLSVSFSICIAELSIVKKDKSLKELEDKIVNDILSHKVMVYSKTYCPYSKRLKAILANYEIDDLKIVELDKTQHTEEMQEILKKYSGRTTVPQLFISGRFVGGHDETKAIDDKGELRTLLEKAHALFTNRVPIPDNEVIEMNSEALQAKSSSFSSSDVRFLFSLFLIPLLL